LPSSAFGDQREGVRPDHARVRLVDDPQLFAFVDGGRPEEPHLLAFHLDFERRHGFAGDRLGRFGGREVWDDEGGEQAECRNRPRREGKGLPELHLSSFLELGEGEPPTTIRRSQLTLFGSARLN